MRSAIVVTAILLAGGAHAVETINPREELDFDRPESWGMKYFASVTLMTGMGPPRPVRFGSVRIALDGGWVPELSLRQRTIGFDGTKAEALNQTPVYGHARAEFGLPWQVTATIAWLPPIPIAHLQANLFSFSLARPIWIGRGFSFGLRAFGQVGYIKGSFTCDELSIRKGGDANPFGCTQPSHDQVSLSYAGLEVSGGYRIARAHGLEPYFSVAGDYMGLQFQVGAQYAGIIDNTQQVTSGATFWGTAGLNYPITRRLDIGTELFYSPLSVRRLPDKSTTEIDGLFNVRAQIAYRFY